MNTNTNENRQESLTSQQSPRQSEGGYGSPTPEDEMPAEASINPGSPDPTLRGQETDQEALDHDENESLGAPDRNFFQNEDAGSDGEPGAGRLGGTDDQFLEELDRSGASAAQADPEDETPMDVPSTEAPLKDGNSGPTRSDRESFSSEPEEDAAGEDQ